MNSVCKPLIILLHCRLTGAVPENGIQHLPLLLSLVGLMVRYDRSVKRGLCSPRWQLIRITCGAYEMTKAPPQNILVRISGGEA